LAASVEKRFPDIARGEEGQLPDCTYVNNSDFLWLRFLVSRYRRAQDFSVPNVIF
jgi:hypothetical protein